MPAIAWKPDHESRSVSSRNARGVAAMADPAASLITLSASAISKSSPLTHAVCSGWGRTLGAIQGALDVSLVGRSGYVRRTC